MTKHQHAKLFTSGGSQAVRLPAEFRFEGKEVRIRRDPISGEVILSPIETWDEYFAWAQTQEWGPPLERDQRIDDFQDRTALDHKIKRRPAARKVRSRA